MKNSKDKMFSLYLQQKEGSSSKYEAVVKQKDNVVSKGTWQCHCHTKGTSSPSYHCSGRLLRVASATLGSGSSGLDFWITPVRTEMLTGRHFSMCLSLKWRDQCSYTRKYNDDFIASPKHFGALVSESSPSGNCIMRALRVPAIIS